MTVNNTRPFCRFLALSWLDRYRRYERAFELLVLRVSHNEVGNLGDDSTEILSQRGTRVFGISAARRSYNQRNERVAETLLHL
jgi:hypothetical protein